jgi:hypothetical protein
MSTNSTTAWTILALFDIAVSRSRRSSGTRRSPMLGSTVGERIARPRARCRRGALNSDDLPAFGQTHEPDPFHGGSG